MNFVLKRRIKLEFVIAGSESVGISNLEKLIREHTDDIKVEETSYLSEVPSEGSEETRGTTASTREYKRARSYIDSQASEASEESSRDYYGPCDQNSAVSDATEISDLSEYSSAPTNVVTFRVSEPDGESLGSKDTVRSADSESENLSFISYSESIHESTAIQSFVRQNDEQELKLYRTSKRNREPFTDPTLGIKRTRYWK